MIGPLAGVIGCQMGWEPLQLLAGDLALGGKKDLWLAWLLEWKESLSVWLVMPSKQPGFWGWLPSGLDDYSSFPQ